MCTRPIQMEARQKKTGAGPADIAQLHMAAMDHHAHTRFTPHHSKRLLCSHDLQPFLPTLVSYGESPEGASSDASAAALRPRLPAPARLPRRCSWASAAAVTAPARAP